MFVQVLVGNVGSSVVYLVEDWCMDNEYGGRHLVSLMAGSIEPCGKI